MTGNLLISCGNSDMSFAQTSNTGLMFFIYFHMESHQMVLTLSSSNTFASCTELGILTLNLCVRNQYFKFSFPMVRLRFTITCQIHRRNAGSFAIRRSTAYSAIYTGYKSFIYLRVILMLCSYPSIGQGINPICCISATLCSGTRCDERVILLYFCTLIPMAINLLK